MADIVKIKKHIQYQSKYAIYFLVSGETRSLEFIKDNFASHIIDAYLKDGTFELFTQKQELPATQDVEIDLTPIQEIQEPAFEIVYKTTKPIQDKDGNQIEVGSQFTQSELKEKGFGKRKLAGLLEEQSLIELKIVKWFHTLGILKK